MRVVRDRKPGEDPEHDADDREFHESETRPPTLPVDTDTTRSPFEDHGWSPLEAGHHDDS